MSDDRLAFLLRSPAIVESVVRATLHAALEARRTYGRSIDARDFANETLAQLDRTLVADGARLHAVGRHELATETLRATMRFVSSPLAQRLFSIDPRRLCAAPDAADAAIRDAANRLHFVRLENFAGDAERVTSARELLKNAHALGALRSSSVHFFSLRSARFRSFPTPAAATRREQPRDRNAA